MPDPREAADVLLKQYGCVLLRQNKHQVWLLPDGKKYTRALTPSDPRSDDNALRQLKGMLGVNGIRGEAGERRERKVKSKPNRIFLATVTPHVEVDRHESIREKLMKIVHIQPRKYGECYAMRKQVILQTPFTVILRRLFP